MSGLGPSSSIAICSRVSFGVVVYEPSSRTRVPSSVFLLSRILLRRAAVLVDSILLQNFCHFSIPFFLSSFLNILLPFLYSLLSSSVNFVFLGFGI